MKENYFPCLSMRLAMLALDDGCHVEKHINPKRPTEFIWYIYIHSEHDLDLIQMFFRSQGLPAPAVLKRCVERYREEQHHE